VTATGGPPRGGEEGLVLWAANRMPAGLDERLAVAAAGGFTSMSLFPLDVRLARAAGTSARDLAARAADAGCPVTVLDPFTHWVPRWEPAGPLDEATRAFLDVDGDEFFATAAELGVATMTVIEPFGTAYDVDELAGAFARVCDRAAGAGLRVQLEALPWSGVPHVGTAWEVVRRAGRDNGGVVVDAWPLFRGTAGPDVVEQVPGERVFAVQLADGPATPAADPVAESTYDRRLPGAGDVDLARRRGGRGPEGRRRTAAGAHLRAPPRAVLRCSRGGGVGARGPGSRSAWVSSSGGVGTGSGGTSRRPARCGAEPRACRPLAGLRRRHRAGGDGRRRAGCPGR